MRAALEARVTQRLPELSRISTQDRNLSVWVAERRGKIDPWLASMPSNNRLMMTHPKTIKNKYLRLHPEEKEEEEKNKPERAKRTSMREALNQQTQEADELRRIIDDLRQELSAKEREIEDLRGENAALLQEINKPTKRKPRITGR